MTYVTYEEFNKLSPIEKFEVNLKNCCDMGDRKQAVQWLAKEIGAAEANKIAIEHGLNSSYYLA